MASTSEQLQNVYSPPLKRGQPTSQSTGFGRIPTQRNIGGQPTALSTVSCQLTALSTVGH